MVFTAWSATVVDQRQNSLPSQNYLPFQDHCSPIHKMVARHRQRIGPLCRMPTVPKMDSNPVLAPGSAGLGRRLPLPHLSCINLAHLPRLTIFLIHQTYFALRQNLLFESESMSDFGMRLGLYTAYDGVCDHYWANYEIRCELSLAPHQYEQKRHGQKRQLDATPARG